jgi:diaminopimelate decarboxylase
MNMSYSTAGTIRSEHPAAGGTDSQVLFPQACPDLEIQAAIASRCAAGEPGFFVDMARFKWRCAMASSTAARCGIRLLYATKSFTNGEILRAVAASGMGFDISNKREFDLVARHAGTRPFISLTSPGLLRDEMEYLCRMIGAGSITRFYCDSLHQLEEFCSRLRNSDVGIRVNLNGETIPDGVPIYVPSRFGIQLSDLKTAHEIASSFGCRVRWIHLHNAPKANDLASFLLAGRVMLERSQEVGIDLVSIDLGGGLCEPAEESGLAKFFEALRSVIPAGIELVLEPGQFWMTDCGYLSTQVIELKQFDDRIVLVTDCGSLNHLQWSDPGLPLMGPISAGDMRPYLVCGRTCFEHDIVGQVTPSPGHPVPLPDSWLVLAQVSGYSVELGCTFNGLAPRVPTMLG